MIYPIVSREAATGTRYFTGKPCRRGHVAERTVSSGACCECLREGERRRYLEARGGLKTRKDATEDRPLGLVELLHPHPQAALLLLRQMVSEINEGPVQEAALNSIRFALSDLHKWNSIKPPPLPNQGSDSKLTPETWS